MGRKSRRRVPVRLDSGEVNGLSDGEVAVALRAADDMIGTGGRTMLTRVLKGSRAKQVLEHGLDRNPSYGAWSELSLEAIQHRVDWLIMRGYLEMEYSGDLPVLVYSERGLSLVTQTICREWFERCWEMMRRGEPYEMDFFRDKARKTVWRLLDAIADSGDPGFLPLLDSWRSIEVNKVSRRIQQVVSELEGKGPRIRHHFERCFLDESLSLFQFRARTAHSKLPFSYGHLLSAAEECPGTQDIEIIQNWLDRNTCLVTNDAALHNAALQKGKFSFFLEEVGSKPWTIRAGPLPGVKLRGILASSEPLSPRFMSSRAPDAEGGKKAGSHSKTDGFHHERKESKECIVEGFPHGHAGELDEPDAGADGNGHSDSVGSGESACHRSHEDAAHDPALRSIVAAVSQDTPSRLKKMRSKRRRIRNYFGGVGNIALVAVTLSASPWKRGSLIGFRLRVSARSGGLKALDASEHYVFDHGTDPLDPHGHVLAVLLQLQLAAAPVQVFCDRPALRLPKTIHDSVRRDAFDTLQSHFDDLRWVDCSKGPLLERLRRKLDDLRNKKSNEILSLRFSEIVERVRCARGDCGDSRGKRNMLVE